MLSERPETDGHWAYEEGAWFRTVATTNVSAEDIPTVECKGLCHDQCSVIPMSQNEHYTLTEASGKEPHTVLTDNGPRCSHLSLIGRCEAYEARPLICRLYGAAEGLICRHGCETTNGKYLSQPEASRLILGLGTPVTLEVRDKRTEATR